MVSLNALDPGAAGADRLAHRGVCVMYEGVLDRPAQVGGELGCPGAPLCPADDVGARAACVGPSARTCWKKKKGEGNKSHQIDAYRKLSVSQNVLKKE